MNAALGGTYGTISSVFGLLMPDTFLPSDQILYPVIDETINSVFTSKSVSERVFFFWFDYI